MRNIRYVSKRLVDGLPFAGLFSNEGGQFFGGFSMSRDNQANTIGGFSDLWSKGIVTRERVKHEGAATVAYDRALTVHLQIQPSLAEKLFFSQAQFLDQGFAARFLISMPESTQGYRALDPDQPATDLDAQLAGYHARIKEMLEFARLRVDEDSGELKRSTVILSKNAFRMYAEFYNRLQVAVRPDGEFAEIAAVAQRGAENAVRLALCLHAYEDHHAATLNADTMQRGVTLAEFYLSEAARLFGHGEKDAELDRAERLAVWFKDKWLTGAIAATKDLPMEQRAK